jgi:type I site-specific deoxyribonuclease, hsdR family
MVAISINEEMIPGHLSADTDFNSWQENRQMNLVKEFAKEWGLDSLLLSKSLKSYDLKKLEEIPFREDLVKTLDATKATNQFAGNKLKLNMELNKVLPQWMQEVKMKFR